MHAVSEIKRHVIDDDDDIVMDTDHMSASSHTTPSSITIRVMKLSVWTTRDLDTVKVCAVELNQELISMRMDINLFKRSGSSTKILTEQIFPFSQLGIVRVVPLHWVLPDS